VDFKITSHIVFHDTFVTEVSILKEDLMMMKNDKVS